MGSLSSAKQKVSLIQIQLGDFFSPLTCPVPSGGSFLWYSNTRLEHSKDNSKFKRLFISYFTFLFQLCLCLSVLKMSMYIQEVCDFLILYHGDKSIVTVHMYSQWILYTYFTILHHTYFFTHTTGGKLLACDF